MTTITENNVGWRFVQYMKVGDEYSVRTLGDTIGAVWNASGAIIGGQSLPDIGRRFVCLAPGNGTGSVEDLQLNLNAILGPISGTVDANIISSIDLPVHITSSVDLATHITSSVDLATHITSSADLPVHITSSVDLATHITSSSDLPVHITSSVDLATHITSSSDLPVHITSSSDLPVHITSSEDLPVHVTSSSDLPVHITSSVPLDVIGTVVVSGTVDATIIACDVTIPTDTSIIACEVDLPVHITSSVDLATHITSSSDLPVHITSSVDLATHITSSADLPVHITSSVPLDVIGTVVVSGTVDATIIACDITIPTDTSIIACEVDLPVHITSSVDLPVHITSSVDLATHITSSVDLATHITSSADLPVHITSSSDLPVHITSSVPLVVSGTVDIGNYPPSVNVENTLANSLYIQADTSHPIYAVINTLPSIAITNTGFNSNITNSFITVKNKPTYSVSLEGLSPTSQVIRSSGGVLHTTIITSVEQPIISGSIEFVKLYNASSATETSTPLCTMGIASGQTLTFVADMNFSAGLCVRATNKFAANDTTPTNCSFTMTCFITGYSE